MPPITLFTYDRLEHTRRTIQALLCNLGVSEYDLIIYSDAPRTPDKMQAVTAVREYLQTITGFRSITIHHRPYNYGLARSIIDGVTQVLSHHDQIIVLEDDLVTSPHFLNYMNEALTRYANDERVISVHAYIPPVQYLLPEAFFLRGADCWGWATWRRGWELFNPNGCVLLNELKRQNLIKKFDFNGSYEYSKMLEDQVKGFNNSWAIRWYASAFLANKLTLYPGRSLIHNIGHDGSGTHCASNSTYDITLSLTPIRLTDVEIESSELAFRAFENFFKNSQLNLFSKIIRRFKNILAKLLI